MDKLKILELTDAYYPNVDGVVSVVKNYAKNLSSVCVCHVAAPKPSKKSGYKDTAKYKVFRCKSIGGAEGYKNATPLFDKKFKKAIKAENYDLLHAHTPFGMGRFAVKMAKKHKIPLVATLHTQYHLDFQRTLGKHNPLVKFMLWYIRKTYKNADCVLTVSNASKKFLKDYGYNGEVKVIRNATDFVYPENANELIARVNKDYNLEGQKNVFLFVGRMAMYKNIGLIAEALKIVKEQNKDFKMIFVGGGFDLEKIKAISKELGIYDNCIFTGSITDRTYLQALYLRSDLFLFPSTFDTAGICIFEAAAHKVASVVVKGSCSAEEVVDKENGFLCELNKESLANVLLELISSPEKMKEAGENAYKTLYRTWGDLAKEVLETYKQVIKEYQEKHSNKQ